MYAVTKTNGSLLTNIADQTFDTTSTALTLVGRGAVNYGPAFDGNFVALMENFANSIAPPSPLVGQLWYDTAAGLMRVFASSNAWITLSNIGGLGNTVGMKPGRTLGGVVSGNRLAGSVGFALTNTTTGAATTVCLTLSEGKIISVASCEAITTTSLPSTVTIEGQVVVVAARFPNGISAGVTLASDPAGYVNAGTATAALYS